MQYSEINVDGQVIRVGIKEGLRENTPWLVFNGLGVSLELLQGFVTSAAAADYEIISFDIPGTGKSKTPLLPYRFSSIAKLANKILDLYGYKNVDVLGFSWGGALAQQFAKDYGSRCRKLILAATSTGHISFPPNPTMWFKLLLPQFYSQASSMAQIGAKAISNPFRGFCYQLLASNGWTSIHWLHTLKQPTLILSGTNDPIVPVSNAKLMNKLLPNSEMIILKSGHMFLVTKPDITATYIRDFINTESVLNKIHSEPFS